EFIEKTLQHPHHVDEILALSRFWLGLLGFDHGANGDRGQTKHMPVNEHQFPLGVDDGTVWRRRKVGVDALLGLEFGKYVAGNYVMRITDTLDGFDRLLRTLEVASQDAYAERTALVLDTAV